MASNYTAHYGLCQWEPGDNFVRAEFNGDNLKLEATLQSLSGRSGALEEALPLVSYNVYNLMLQNYYDDKQTGYKKALVFDGFADGNMIASLSSSIMRLDNRLSLMRTGQGDISMGEYSGRTPTNIQLLTSPVGTATHYGILTGATVKTVNLVSEAQVMATWELKVYFNGSLVHEVSMPTYCAANSAATEQNLKFPPRPVKPGDSFYMTMKADNANHQVMTATTGHIGGHFDLTPIGGTSGTSVTPPLTLPDRKRLRGWLKHRGGAVTLSVRDSGVTDHPMTVAATRQTVSLQGVACTEEEFVLDPAPASGTLAFSLGMSPGAANDMDVFDYGVMLI